MGIVSSVSSRDSFVIHPPNNCLLQYSHHTSISTHHFPALSYPGNVFFTNLDLVHNVVMVINGSILKPNQIGPHDRMIHMHTIINQKCKYSTKIMTPIELPSKVVCNEMILPFIYPFPSSPSLCIYLHISIQSSVHISIYAYYPYISLSIHLFIYPLF